MERSKMRVGIGYDVHPLTPGRRLVLGGIDIPFDKGLGGWSDGLAMEGFDVTGVDISKEIVHEYKHELIIADIRELDPEDFKSYDLIVGSPPCRDFSVLAAGFGHLWKDPPNPQRGLKLIHAFMGFINVAEPTYWLMENVPRLSNWFKLKPRALPRLSPTMRRAFWGNFPSFLVPTGGKALISHTQGPLRSWERSRIPLPVARALGQAVRGALLKR